MARIAAPTSTMTVVVCDDDPLVRSVVCGLVEDHDGRVVAEAFSPWQAIEQVERLQPDVVVLDLSLKGGTGLDVIQQLRRSSGTPPYVVVFTAYDAPTGLEGDFVDVVRKPDFDHLVERLTSGARRRAERRRTTREVPGPKGSVDDVNDFFKVLASAHPGDQLVRFTAGDAVLDEVAGAVRRSVRSQDRVLRRSDDVLAILIDGGSAATDALLERLRPTIPRSVETARAADVGTDPIVAFQDLTGG
ncbi:MAG: response regulator [Acidimicrobiia bacterium]